MLYPPDSKLLPLRRKLPLRVRLSPFPKNPTRNFFGFKRLM
jgi:hypothetical protein